MVTGPGLQGNLNHPDSCWKGNTAEYRQPRRFQESIDGNCLTQVIKETRKDALLDLIFINNKGLVGDMKVRDTLGCSDKDMMEFRMPRGKNKANSRSTALDMRRADLGLFSDLLGGIVWDRVLERREVQEDWLIFRLLMRFSMLSPITSPQAS